MSNLLEKASILLTPTAYDDGKILSVKPIDGSGDFDFTRNSSATRVNSQGLIEDMQILSSNLVSNGDFSQQGPELITNGDFATDTNWTKGTGWSISGGTANCDGTQTAGTQLVQNGTYTLNKTYKITYTLSSVTAGNVDVRLQGSGATVTGNSRTIDGTYTEYITSTGNTSFRIRGNDDFIGSIDNVSVKEVGQDWTLDAGWSISEGLASRTNTGAYGAMYQNCLESGKKYKATIKITSITSQAFFGVRLGTNYILQGITQPGTYTAIGVSTSATLSIMGNPTFAGSIDSIKIIEITDDTNLPRIDYSPYSGAGTCGHWLFEPQSTQTATYSNDFTQGDIFVSSSDPSVQDTVLTSQQTTSPDGTNNAWLLKDDNSGGTGTSNLRYTGTNLNSNDFNIVSVFVKKALTNNFIALSSANFDSSANGTSWFNISNGSLGIIDSDHTAKIEDYGNDWYRCSITFKTTTDTSGAVRIRLASTDGSVNVSLDGTNGSYLFGLQCESSATQNYATSYIPTSGSTVTRLADAASGAGSSDLINSTEGVLYAEIASLANDGTSRCIALSDGSTSNRVNLLFDTSNNAIRSIVVSGSSTQFDQEYVVSSTTNYHKIAVKYKANDFALWIDGVERFTDASGIAPIGLNDLSFNVGSGSLSFFGKAKCVAVFKEALTDDELECLTTDETSFSSFNALALANNYTII